MQFDLHLWKFLVVDMLSRWILLCISIKVKQGKGDEFKLYEQK